MATKTFAIEDFYLNSSWANSGGHYTVRPNQVTATKVFHVTGIPSGAKVTSATLTCTAGSPRSGIDIFTINGSNASSGSNSKSISVSGNGDVSVDFVFRANGISGDTDGNHVGSLTISNCSLAVVYDTNVQPEPEPSPEITLATEGLIVLFGPKEKKFSGNGICVLAPDKCTITEEAAGEYELEMEHPFDEYGKYLMLHEDYIIRAPVPKMEIPQITMPTATLWHVKSGITTKLYSRLPTYTSSKTDIDKIKEDSTHYQWDPNKFYPAGSYVVYEGQIHKAIKDVQFTDPDTGSYTYWQWICAVTGSGQTGTSSGGQYDPGTVAETLQGGAIIAKVADYNGSYMQVRSLRGTIGYVLRSDCEETSQTETPTIAARTITTQLFRIYAISCEDDIRRVTVNARHISYDFQKNSLFDCQINDAEPSTAIAILQGSLMLEDSRMIACNITGTKISGDYSFVNPVQALLDPDDGIVPSIHAKLIRDNGDFYLLNNTAGRKGPDLIYGKNLLGVTWEKNIEDVVTRIVPRADDGNKGYVYLDELYVDSPLISDYGVISISVMDIDYSVGQEIEKPDGTKVTLTREDILQKLREAGENAFAVQGVDKPKISLKVKFVLMGDTEQYEQYRGLQYVNLYDTINVMSGPSGFVAATQVIGYEWDCLLKRYNEISVGSLYGDTGGTVPGYQLAQGAVNTRSIAVGAVGGSAIRANAITTENLAAGAVTAEKLAAGSITADIIGAGSITADKLAAGSVTTEKLAANAITAEKINAQAITSEKIDAGAITAGKIAANAITAEKINAQAITSEKIDAGAITAGKIAANAITADKISAGAITAGSLDTSVLNTMDARIGSADIDFAHIKDLTADQAIITRGSGEKLFIHRLAVDSAQMVDLTVGQLTIKGKNGNYYSLDVDIETGNVTATQVTVSASEIAAGQTASGQHIIETDLTVSELNTSSAIATEALINKLTAGRLDVDTLFARQATINKLNAIDITGNQYLRLYVGNTVQESIDDVEVGGRNFLLKSNVASEKTASTTSVNSGVYYLSPYGKNQIVTDADLTVSFDYEITSASTGALNAQLNFYNVQSTAIVPDISEAMSGRVSASFKVTASQAGYTDNFQVRIRMTGTTSGAKLKVWNLQLEKGTIASDWSAAPEDLEGRVTETEASITLLDNQITTKVSRSDYEAAVEDLGDRLTTAETAIDQTPDMISLSAQRTIEIVGSRNLIRSTLHPDVTVESTRPNLMGLCPMATSAGTILSADHGMGVINDGAVRPYLSFGSNTGSSSSLYGLSAGETYTLSFDAIWNLLSGSISTSADAHLYAGLYVNYTSLDTTVAKTSANQYLDFGTIRQADRGTSMNGRCAFTFTIPPSATNIQLRITCDFTPSSYYAANDYLYVKNLKLEKGDQATVWTAAPEDADRVQNSSLQISPDGIEMKSGVIDMEAGSKFRVKSGGKFEVFATDDASYISFGGTEQSPNFSLGSGGTVNAKRGVFDELTVKSSSMMQAMNGSLGDKIMVSDTQPTGHGILWVQPSAVTQVDFILPGSHGEDMSGETPSQELTGFLPQGGQLGGTQCTYGVKLSIGNITGTCRWEYVKVQAQKSSGGSKITIYEKTYASGNQPIIHPYDSFVIDTLNSPSAALTNLTDAASITLTVTIRKSDSTYARFNVNENFILRCTGTGSATAQACNVYFIP